MLERGAHVVCAEASSNAKAFYLQRGYRLTGAQTPKGAWPIEKQLVSRISAA
jgi:putative acetyltransferase